MMIAITRSLRESNIEILEQSLRAPLRELSVSRASFSPQLDEMAAGRFAL